MTTYSYTLRLPNGETTTVSGILENPTQYAALLPSGWSIISSTQHTQQTTETYPTYRLIIETAPGRVDTGATLPGCTSDTPALCDPQQFADTPSAFAYAHGRNEIPVVVASAEQAWSIANEEERARQLQAQYTGPSQSPEPLPGQGGLPTGGIVATLEANPALVILGGFVLYKLLK